MVSAGFQRVVALCRRTKFDALRLIREIQTFRFSDGTEAEEMPQQFTNDIIERITDHREGALIALCDQWDQGRLSNLTLIWAIVALETYDQPLATLLAHEIVEVFLDQTNDEVAILERRIIEKYIEKYSEKCEILRQLQSAINTKSNTFSADNTFLQCHSTSHITGGEWPSNYKFFLRQEFELKLRKEIADLCNDPKPGALIVYGEGGIGKTSLVIHALQDENFIGKECRTVKAVTWLNVCEMTMAERFDDVKFYSALVELLSEVHIIDPSTPPNLSAINRSFNKNPPNVLLVFDDVFCNAILGRMLQLSRNKGVIRSIAITRNYKRAIVEADNFQCRQLQVETMSDESLQQMLGEHFKLKERHGLDDSQIERLAKMCHGLPLIATVMNSQFQSAIFEDEATATYERLVHNLRNIGTTEVAGKGSQMTVSALLLYSQELQSGAFRDDYFTFLIFEPGHAVDIDDLAVLWKCSRGEVVRRCQKAVAASLMAEQVVGGTARSTPSSYTVHALLHTAAVESARQHHGKAASLHDLRKIILAKCLSIPGEKNSLLLAIRGQRKKLLQTFQKYGDAKALAEIASDWDMEDGTTAFHQLASLTLYESQKWILNENMPTESCLSGELFCRFADAAADDNIDRMKELFRTKRDKRNGKTILDYVAMTMNGEQTNGKWHNNLFLTAAKYGCDKLVKLLLAEDATKQFTAGSDVNGNNVLIIAAGNGELETVEALVASGTIDVNAQNKRGETALIKSVRFVICLDLAKALCAASRPSSVDANLADVNGDTALIAAARYGRLELVRYLVNEQKANVVIVNKLNNANALEMAVALKWHPEIGRFLVEKGVGMIEEWYEAAVRKAQMNRQQEFLEYLNDRKQYIIKIRQTKPATKPQAPDNADNGETMPLHDAAKHGELEAIKALLATGGDVNKRDQFMKTPLMWACGNGHFEIAKLLADRGTSIDDQSPTGRTALMYACENGHLEIATLLVDRGTSIDLQSQSGRTAFMFACQNGYFEIAKLLVDQGTSIDVQSQRGCTALMYACEKGRFKIAKLLVDRGTSIDVQEQTGVTALMFACKNGHFEIAKLFVDLGANIWLSDRVGNTALKFALRNNNTDIIHLLTSRLERLQCVS